MSSSLVHSSHGSGGSDVSHPQSTSFECAIAHDIEELCSLFDHGLSGEPDKDETNEGEDLVVVNTEGGDNPGANGSMAPPPAGSTGQLDCRFEGVGECTVWHLTWQDDTMLGWSIHSQGLTEEWLADWTKCAVTLAGERPTWISQCLCVDIEWGWISIGSQVHLQVVSSLIQLLMPTTLLSISSILLTASGGEKANNQCLLLVSGIMLSVLGRGSNSLCTELAQETYDHAWSCLLSPDWWQSDIGADAACFHLKNNGLL